MILIKLKEWNFNWNDLLCKKISRTFTPDVTNLSQIQSVSNQILLYK